jgi:hypothetical protein
MDPFSMNVLGVTDLVESQTNKLNAGEYDVDEGVVSDEYDALSLTTPDEDLLKKRDEYERRYAPYETKHKERVRKNLESYLGKKANGQWLGGENTIADNLQFPALETFLAAALAKNPEPVVFADNTTEGNDVADAVKTMLAYHADQLVIRRKLAATVRQWSINNLGVLKPGWDKQINEVMMENRKVEDYVFDPNGYVDAYGDFVGFYGERIKVTAEKLIYLFPKHKDYIHLIVNGALATEVQYTEWWNEDSTFTFTTFKEKVLDKYKNPYFRYPEPDMTPDGQPILGEDGEPQMIHPRNHFAKPKKPGIFLSVYSLQNQPHDITGNLEQNIPIQNRITRRGDQIDLNASAANNSYAFSEDNFNEETAKQAANARRNGSPILVPSGGPIAGAIVPLHGQDLPSGMFESHEKDKEALMSSWGVQGITSQPANEDTTARGMILNQSHDTSRIGGGIGDAIEQVADNAFNWLVQLYYVFYDEPHFAAIMGNAKAVEFVTVSSQDLDRQLIVSVSPDSMRPRDEVTTINLAQALFDKGAIGPKTLLKMVDFPDVDEAAADGVLWKIDPQAYFQLNFHEHAAQLQQIQAQQAQQQAMQQAQAQGMSTAATAANTPPEATTEPQQNIAEDPASAALSNVSVALPQ